VSQSAVRILGIFPECWRSISAFALTGRQSEPCPCADRTCVTPRAMRASCGNRAVVVDRVRLLKESDEAIGSYHFYGVVCFNGFDGLLSSFKTTKAFPAAVRGEYQDGSRAATLSPFASYGPQVSKLITTPIIIPYDSQTGILASPLQAHRATPPRFTSHCHRCQRLPPGDRQLYANLAQGCRCGRISVTLMPHPCYCILTARDTCSSLRTTRTPKLNPM
jgi:hypothetical protein